MFKAQSFDVSSRFKELSVELESLSWRFHFSNHIFLTVDGFWRLFDKGTIVVTSNDERQQFGQDIPIDVLAIVQRELKGAILQKIEIREGTGDVLLKFSNDKQIEVLISSMGYENYDLQINGSRYIASGNDIFIVS